ncbi:MAG: nucleotidyltransferase substrate binding protein (TIGR01987 family) [Dokdonia sp.]|jgi:nucleotidyltransferase substrate binding protein (TIGR01987 family)
MGENDIRWLQRFQNFNKAFDQLELFLAQGELNKLEEQGLIKAFEYTFELAWKTLQDLLKHKGYLDIVGPKPVIKQSFQDGYITNGQGWLRMQKSRNLTSHTYNEEIAEEIVSDIQGEYFQYLNSLKQRLETEKQE